MGDTGQVNVRVDSAEELLSMAQALEQEAAARYRGLAARMTRQGDAEMAAQFESLAKMEDGHAEHIAERGVSMFHRRPAPARAKWETPPSFDEDEARGAELSAYKALAFAVRNEERAFAFYSYLAAEAESPDIRRLAEEMASEELQHAALLRQYRRSAFRRQRPATIETPQSVEELRGLARRWDAEAAAAHAALADALEAKGELADARIFRRLAEEEQKSAKGAAAAATLNLRGAGEGLRAIEEYFDRYASIAERSQDEGVVAEAQELASRIVGRLALAGGARSNTLLGSE
jgi:rubrerythrin